MSDRDGAELFAARVTELAARAARGEIAVGDFYNPHEIREASSILERNGYGGSFAFYGGCPGAERARLVALPDYALYGFDTPEDAAASAAADDVAVLRVAGSGYRELTHRDFMGAILSLGIKRSVVGDIIPDEDMHGAYVFCGADIAPYIAENLTKVASDTVRTFVTELPAGFSAEKKTVPVSDTVASPRADSVVGSLARVSRERAKELIVSGAVEINYDTATKPDAAVRAGDIISIRGTGKFKIVSIDGVTRRGRLRLEAGKYT